MPRIVNQIDIQGGVSQVHARGGGELILVNQFSPEDRRRSAFTIMAGRLGSLRKVRDAVPSAPTIATGIGVIVAYNTYANPLSKAGLEAPTYDTDGSVVEFYDRNFNRTASHRHTQSISPLICSTPAGPILAFRQGTIMAYSWSGTKRWELEGFTARDVGLVDEEQEDEDDDDDLEQDEDVANGGERSFATAKEAACHGEVMLQRGSAVPQGAPLAPDKAGVPGNSTTAPDALTSEILLVLKTHGWVPAIKRYRESMPVDLREAKQAVEAIAVRYSVSPASEAFTRPPSSGSGIQIRPSYGAGTKLRPWHIAGTGDGDESIVSVDSVVVCLTGSGETKWCWKGPAGVYDLGPSPTGGAFALVLGHGVVELDSSGQEVHWHRSQKVGKGTIAVDAADNLVCINAVSDGLYFVTSRRVVTRVEEADVHQLRSDSDGKYVAFIQRIPGTAKTRAATGTREDAVKVYSRSGGLLLDEVVEKVQDVVWLDDKLICVQRDRLTVWQI